MLSLTAYALPAPAREEEGGFDPGIFSLIARVVSGLGRARREQLERGIEAFVDANGGHLTDDVERRIGTGFVTGRF